MRRSGWWGVVGALFPAGLRILCSLTSGHSSGHNTNNCRWRKTKLKYCVSKTELITKPEVQIHNKPLQLKKSLWLF